MNISAALAIGLPDELSERVLNAPAASVGALRPENQSPRSQVRLHDVIAPSLRPEIYAEREMYSTGSTPRNSRKSRNDIRTSLAVALVENVPPRTIPAKEVARHVESSIDTIDARRQGNIPVAWAEMIEYCRAYPAFGMEVLEQMGIDIDQDRQAFAIFLQLQNQVRGGHR
jgi:hypothetical protein